MLVKAFFDEATWTLTYVAYDAESGDAIIIDPVLDFDPLAWSTSTSSLDSVEAWVKSEELKVHAIIDTHAHADHLSGVVDLKRRFTAPMGIGARITEVQEVFKGIYNFDGVYPSEQPRRDSRFSSA